MSTQAERLRQVVQQHAPAYPEDQGGRARGFQRQIRHVGRIAGSWYAVRQYLEGTRPIPDSVLEAAAQLYPDVDLEWLQYGDGKPPERPPTQNAGEGTIPPPASREQPGTPWSDVAEAVRRAGPEPSDEALSALDPRFPRGGLTRRNWALLYAIAGEGKTPEQVAQETGLPARRIKGIAEEYAALVRQAAGLE